MGNLIIVSLLELWFGPNNNPTVPEILKFPLLTTIQAFNLLAKLALENQHRWRNSNKATKVVDVLVLPV